MDLSVADSTDAPEHPASTIRAHNQSRIAASLPGPITIRQNGSIAKSVSFQPLTLALLRLIAARRPTGAAILGHAEKLVNEFAWVGFFDGVPMGCGGIVPLHRGIDPQGVPCGLAEAWVIIGAAVPKRAWPAITARTLQELERAHAQGFRLIEMTAVSDAAIRWARRLEFETHGIRPGWGPSGENAVLMGRARLPDGTRVRMGES